MGICNGVFRSSVGLVLVVVPLEDVDGRVNEVTLSATIGPDVALVSAAITTPPSKIQPTIVVPVLVALGSGTPCACKAALRL